MQGWLRELDITKVRAHQVDALSGELAGRDAVFVSEEDLLDPDGAEAWCAHVPAVVLTRAEQGTTIWSDNCTRSPACARSQAVDPTGAGDVFAAAFMVRLHESGDAVEAGRFATAAAALAVQGRGIEAIGNRAAIESLLRQEAALAYERREQPSRPGCFRHRQPEGRRRQDHDRRSTSAPSWRRTASALLLIDLDPQANATAGLGLRDAERPAVYDVVIDEAPLAGVIIETAQSGLYLAPSGPDLAGAEVELVPAMAREQRLQTGHRGLGGRLRRASSSIARLRSAC